MKSVTIDIGFSIYICPYTYMIYYERPESIAPIIVVIAPISGFSVRVHAVDRRIGAPIPVYSYIRIGEVHILHYIFLNINIQFFAPFLLRYYFSRFRTMVFLVAQLGAYTYCGNYAQ